MHSGCRDFVTGAPVDIMTFFNDQIDIHHVFPRAWCKEQGIPAAVYDSIVNKTPLSKASNIAIGGEPPSVYLQKIEQKQSINSAEIDDILRTHLIEPQHLRNDDFETFMRVRTKALSDIIARAMGKPVVEEAGADEQESEIDMDMHADEENNLQ
jgi:hypothetical protein